MHATLVLPSPTPYPPASVIGESAPDSLSLPAALADHRGVLDLITRALAEMPAEAAELLSRAAAALRSGMLSPMAPPARSDDLVHGAQGNHGTTATCTTTTAHLSSTTTTTTPMPTDGDGDGSNHRHQPRPTGGVLASVLRGIFGRAVETRPGGRGAQARGYDGFEMVGGDKQHWQPMGTVLLERHYAAWCATVKSLVDGLARRDKSRFVRVARIDVDRLLLRVRHGEHAGLWGTDMPRDVLAIILGHLTTDDAKRCSHVCAQWNRAFSDDRTWMGLYTGRWCARIEAEGRVLARAERMRTATRPAVAAAAAASTASAPAAAAPAAPATAAPAAPADSAMMMDSEGGARQDHSLVAARREAQTRSGLLKSWRARMRETGHAVASFNVDATARDPSRAIARFVDLGLLDPQAVPEELASFLLDYAGISHAAASQYLCRRGPEIGDYFRAARDAYFAERIRCATVHLADGAPPTEFLRATLAAIHLPRESNQIGMVLRSVSRYYHSSRLAPRGMFASPDACYVFLHAMLMVNTVAHNRSVHSWQVIPLDAVVTSMQGMNDGADFGRGQIEEMYVGIRAREMRFSAGMYTRPARETAQQQQQQQNHQQQQQLYTMEEMRDGILSGAL
jgi:hypothetical protein